MKDIIIVAILILIGMQLVYMSFTSTKRENAKNCNSISLDYVNQFDDAILLASIHHEGDCIARINFLKPDSSESMGVKIRNISKGVDIALQRDGEVSDEYQAVKNSIFGIEIK